MENTREFLVRVSAHPELYNTDHPLYSDVQYRKRLWDQLGDELQVTGDAARLKFKNCRDAYVRAQRRNKSSRINKYRYQDLLEAMVGVPVHKEEVVETEVIRPEVNMDRQLIQRVRCHPELYNGLVGGDKELKSRLWKEIGRELRLSGEQAKAKFRNMKDCYLRSFKTKTTYKYHDLLSTFLSAGVSDPLLVEEAEVYKFSVDLMKAVECRPVLYNGDECKEVALQEIWEEIADNLGRSVTDCQQRYGKMKMEWCLAHNERRPYKYGYGMEFLEPYLEVEAATIGSTTAADDEIIEDGNEPIESSDMQMSDSGHQWDNSEEEDTEIGTASGNLMAVQQQQHQHTKGLILSTDADPLKMFFSSMYTTVREMRPKNVLILKKQIFDLVHEMQMKEQEESEP